MLDYCRTIGVENQNLTVQPFPASERESDANQRCKVRDALGRQSIRIADILESLSLSMINKPDEPFPRGGMGMFEFTTAEQGECYLDTTGNAVARLILETYGWQFQSWLPKSVSKGAPAP
jgi:hypothetical protein